MKKMLFSAIAMIAFAGSAFASNEVAEATEVINTEISNSLDIDVLDKVYKTEDCLLTITIYFEDGSSEVRYVLVTGASCEEILGPSKSTTITP